MEGRSSTTVLRRAMSASSTGKGSSTSQARSSRPPAPVVRRSFSALSLSKPLSLYLLLACLYAISLPSACRVEQLIRNSSNKGTHDLFYSVYNMGNKALNPSKEMWRPQVW